MAAPPLIGTYTPPALRRGDRSTCLYRDAEVFITGMHDGRIPWPRCRTAEGNGSGSGLLVNEDLLRAIRTESAAGLQHWFGVGPKAVWRWRREFLEPGGKFRTPGSHAAHAKACKAGAESLKLYGFSDEVCDARIGRWKGRKIPPRWTPERGGWTAAEVKLLRGRLTDAEVAARTGRTMNAVRMKRRRNRTSS